ncbi:MAG TPA: Gfo/Idh/MocA family oxidoreductase [Candidatus Brocadiia bacterium]|nr:Gfo/Idh/MocA family oxidoreductase [Candidatus Brocadiia bacterium]
MGGKKLRVLLAGCGGISRAWLRATAELRDVEVAALVDAREEAARQRQEEFGLKGAIVATDVKAGLERAQPDAVFDCTPPEAHATVDAEALRRGCHVLCEKPLAHSMEAARRTLAAAAKAGRVCAVMQNRRFSPMSQAMRRLAASGALGEITTLNADFYIGAHFGGFRDQMRHVLLLDMAIHTFDAARFMSGQDAVSVYCREWNPKGSWYAHGASAVAVFEMTNGVVFTYRGSWCGEGNCTPWDSQWRMIGSKGSATWDGAETIRAQVAKNKPGFAREMKDLAVKPVKLKAAGHAGVIRDFVECLRKGRTPGTVCTDNIKSLAMVFGAIESAEKGRPVKIRA